MSQNQAEPCLHAVMSLLSVFVLEHPHRATVNSLPGQSLKPQMTRYVVLDAGTQELQSV